jgi:hypothetical protein
VLCLENVNLLGKDNKIISSLHFSLLYLLLFYRPVERKLKNLSFPGQRKRERERVMARFHIKY